jgi:lambda family phage portal protein
MKVTWVDRALAGVWPSYAMRRLSARATMDEVSGVLRKYDAARLNRRTDGWKATGADANAEIGPDLAVLRNRSRELVRNNPYAAKAIRVLASKIWGTGIMPRVSHPDEKVRKLAKDQWKAFVDSCDPEGMTNFYGIGKQAVRAVCESGEALIQYLPRPANWKMDIPLQVRVLEPDYVDLGKTGPTSSGGLIIQGVEYDAAGRRVAYWLFDQHPGAGVSSIRRHYTSQRVSADFVQPVFDVLRAGQVHGVPFLAPAAMKLRDIDELDEARLVKKKIEACFVAFVKTSGDPQSGILGKGKKDGEGRRIEQLAPGMINYLRADEDVQFGNPSGSEGDVDYLIQQLHAVAAGAGITYAQLTGDLRQANYSSLRAGNLDLWGLVDDWQQFMVVPQFCQSTWRRVDSLLQAMGKRGESLARAAIWQPPERPMIDPDKDGRAIDQAIRSGRKTLDQAIAATGRDPEEHLEEIAASNARQDELELVLDTDPRKVSRAGLTQARAAGSTLPDMEGDSDET